MEWRDDGHPADYSHPKVFGFSALAHIKQDKLDSRALKCIFVGYPPGIKGYKLCCRELGYSKCLVIRDVFFDESKMENLENYAVSPPISLKDNSKFEVELLTRHGVKKNKHWKRMRWSILIIIYKLIQNKM